MVRFQKRRDSAGPMLFGPGPRAHRRRRRPRTLGDLEDPVQVQVHALQRALVRAGYNIGSAGVDNRWGPDTRGALQRFLRRIGHTGEAPIEVNSLTLTISIESATWSQLSSAAPGSGGERQSNRSSSSGGGTRTTDPGSAVDQLDEAEDGTPGWQTALLLVGVVTLTGAIAYSITAAFSDDDEADEVQAHEAQLLPQF